MADLRGTEKKETLTILACMAVLLLAGIVFLRITLVSHTDDVTFSRDSGFYRRPFSLRIRAEDGTALYYTLDGSTPDESATPYTEPIRVEDASPRENTLSMRTDISDVFEEEFTVPDFPVEKGTVLRVLAVAPDGTKSYYTKTYFVNRGASVPDGYTVSIVTDADNLFDPEDGIYVTGNEPPGPYTEEEWEANYFRRGRAWERDAQVQIFDKDGKTLVDKKAGIRIHGGMTRAKLPKGFNLYARKAYDGEEVFPCDLFGTGYYAKRLTLETGGNQPVHPVSDYLVQSRISQLEVASKHYIPCELYLNGEYWGLYWICEKFDEEFVQFHYGCDPEDVLICKHGEGDAETVALFTAMQDYIRTHDMSDEACYETACGLVDIESYIDYYAIMMYIARMGDWPNVNYAAWRTLTTGAEAYHDGKWRWMVFDLNSACMGYADATWDFPTLPGMVAGWYDSSPEMRTFASLWVNKSFRERFRARILEIGETCFGADSVCEQIDAFDAWLYGFLEKSWARYYGKDNQKDEVYRASVEAKKTFFQNRYQAVSFWFEDAAFYQWMDGYTYDMYLQCFPPEGTS